MECPFHPGQHDISAGKMGAVSKIRFTNLLVFQVGENDAESDPRGENSPKEKSHLTRKNLGLHKFREVQWSKEPMHKDINGVHLSTLTV